MFCAVVAMRMDTLMIILCASIETEHVLVFVVYFLPICYLLPDIGNDTSNASGHNIGTPNGNDNPKMRCSINHHDAVMHSSFSSHHEHHDCHAVSGSSGSGEDARARRIQSG